MRCSQLSGSPKNIMIATTRPYGNGRTIESSVHTQHPEDNDGTKSSHKNQMIPKSTIAIAGSVPQSKRTTSTAKSKRCDPNSQDIKSSPTSLVASIGNARALKPFWNQRCSEVAVKWWLPTEIDSPVLDSNSSNGSYEQMERTSWFNIKMWRHHQQPNWQRISSQLPPSSLANITGSVDVPKKVMITRKVEIFPSPQDDKVLRRWCGLYRRVYNVSVAKMLDTGRWHWQGHKVVTTFGNIPKNEWYRFLPTNIRKEAYREASVAMSKAPFKNTVKFKTLKIHGRAMRMYAGVKIVDTPSGKKLKFTDSQKMKQFSKDLIAFDIRKIGDINPESTVQVSFEDGKWWLISSFDKERTTTAGKSQIVALDPGVRTFQTTYSPDGTSQKLGDQASCRIFRLMKYIDKLSKFKDRRGRQKRLRMERRVGNLVDEMHWKIAREITTRYDTVVIPPFETQKMARKWNRKINKTAVRMMLRLAHYHFRMKLIHMANKLGSRVIVCTEEYTSKTCGNCSNVHHTLGSAKRFNCPQCSIRLDRDGNGARNICLKAVCC